MQNPYSLPPLRLGGLGNARASLFPPGPLAEVAVFVTKEPDEEFRMPQEI
jgi:hypothetical protein